MTTDKQKKPLHHNETGRECRGGMRGLAGLSWVAAEVPEGYFSGLGITLEVWSLNCKLGSLVYSTRAGKGPR